MENDLLKEQDKRYLRERCVSQAIELIKSMDDTNKYYYLSTSNNAIVNIARILEEYIKNG